MRAKRFQWRLARAPIGHAASGGEYDWRHRHGWSLSSSARGVSGPVAGAGRRPSLIPLPHDFPLSEETVAALKSGMWAVVNEGGGTGAAARCPGIEISGKTGTAQVVSQALEKSAKSSEFKSTAWFVGYAPSDKPEIVVAALVQRGEHSAVAVPIVRDVIKAYFDKKLRPQAARQSDGNPSEGAEPTTALGTVATSRPSCCSLVSRWAECRGAAFGGPLTGAKVGRYDDAEKSRT